MITYNCQEKKEICQNFVNNSLLLLKLKFKNQRIKFMKGLHVKTFQTILKTRKTIIVTNVISSGL